jgi:DNA adenine methylase
MIKPILKWCGGKKALASTLTPLIKNHLIKTGGRYIEPFLGGAAVALNLGLPNMILSDSCEPLIDMYKHLIEDASAVITEAQILIDTVGTDELAYKKIRSGEFTQGNRRYSGRFLYLNKFCFNGLWRMNKKGEFNVPYGKNPNRKLLPLADYESAATALANAELHHEDYSNALKRARSGDIIYLDPPYFKTFAGYHADGFTEEDHSKLANTCKLLANKGVAIIASNSDHERIRQMWDWADVRSIEEQHSVGGLAKTRKKAATVLITKGLVS